MIDTPRVDECLDGMEHGNAIEGLARQMESELSAKNEHAAQQLAACSCAALMDTPESHAKAKIERDNPFWSPAYEDVMRRTAECIKLREEVESRTNTARDIIRRLMEKVNADNEYDAHQCPNGTPCGVCQLVAEAKAFVDGNPKVEGRREPTNNQMKG